MGKNSWLLAKNQDLRANLPIHCCCCVPTHHSCPDKTQSSFTWNFKCYALWV